MEHRWGQRFAVDIAVRVASRPYAVRTGRLTDLSMSGACIKVGMDMRVLTRVQVVIVTPGRHSQATPVISAYVARRHRDVIGVEWCDFGPQAVIELLRSPQARLKERLHHGLPLDPALMHGT